MEGLREHRGADRFVVNEPLAGSFGSAGVTILNMADLGVQVEHAQPLRLATKARLWFKRAEISASVQGIVVWSHLSRTPNEEGKLLYRTGLRIEEGAKQFTEAMELLAVRGLIRLDTDSLERKRLELAAREKARTSKPIMKLLRPEHEIPPDQALLIHHARERLRANPDEALKWYNRAKFALHENGSSAAEAILSHREDVLAVWEYLERSVDLATIVKVFDRK